MNPPLLSFQHQNLLHWNTYKKPGATPSRVVLWVESMTSTCIDSTKRFQDQAPSSHTKRPRPAEAGQDLEMGRLLVLTFILTLTATLVGAGEKGRGRAAEDAEGGAASSSSSPSMPQSRAASSIRIPRLGWGGWHTQGNVQSTILRVHNEQLLEVKCVSDRGCSPSDEAPCSGITFEDVKGIEPGMPYLMTATGFTHGSAGAMACLSVRSSQQGHKSGSGSGDDEGRTWLVGGCQVRLPKDEGVGERVAGGFVSATALTRYEASVCFGANSTAGDTFLVRHISLVPVKSGKTPGAVVKLNNGDDAPPRGCPEEFFVEEGAMSVLDMYESLPSRIEAELPPLHHYSYYGATSLEQWDEIVRSHVQGLEYQAGQEVFEAGCAAGAFLDSLTRQYGVSVHGSDLSPSLIRIARSRIYPGQSKYANRFCASNARNLSYLPDEAFDHSLAFGVLTYAETHSEACKVAKGLLRITRVGGTVFLGQLNDPEVRHMAPQAMEGGRGVPPDYWFKFASETGSKVRVVRGEEVYSRRVIPDLDHYDLHGSYRYNVYLQRGHGSIESMDCTSLKSSKGSGSSDKVASGGGPLRRFTLDGRECKLPFVHGGVVFDDCSMLGSHREWCLLGGEKVHCASHYSGDAEGGMLLWRRDPEIEQKLAVRDRHTEKSNDRR